MARSKEVLLGALLVSVVALAFFADAAAAQQAFHRSSASGRATESSWTDWVYSQAEEGNVFDALHNEVFKCFNEFYPGCVQYTVYSIAELIGRRFYCAWMFYERCNLHWWWKDGKWKVPDINGGDPCKVLLTGCAGTLAKLSCVEIGKTATELTSTKAIFFSPLYRLPGLPYKPSLPVYRSIASRWSPCSSNAAWLALLNSSRCLALAA
ncbi:hypothetical protein HPP92_018310 [Vanilla planifolia]|uniref:Uncharacterized protein n=1 Tax=Vanilla planifolia TaxID=51239 RepID=A0A835Q5H7_VANPL|nr:hypothetical protein HPP92_018310 [Vanilla planifolia]